MGSRDKRHREPKKTKKDTRKINPVTIITTPPPVEVIRKERKREKEEEEE
jgi:hypothetical protein